MVKRRTGMVKAGAGIALVLVLALTLGVLGTHAYRGGHLNRYLCDGACGVEYVLPPEGLGEVAGPLPIAPDLVTASALDAAKVAAAARPALTQPALGDRVGFIVLDQQSGAVLSQHGSGALIPASTTKLLSGFAALAQLGPQTRFATRVLSPAPGSIVLVGGGDPFLDRKAPKPHAYGHQATLTELAARTAGSLKRAGISTVTLGFDDFLFSGPAASPHWPASYLGQNIVTPISALWVDQGVGPNGLRTRAPARAAATSFAALLERQGIVVRPEVAPARVTAAATEVARVESATLAQIVESTIQFSDNEAAEVLARHVALARSGTGSFAAVGAAITAILGEHGIDTAGLRLFDGSGLSRDNRIAPLTLAQTIRVAARQPDTAGLLSDLPVSGFNGSLRHRFSAPAARAGRGVVQAKTGTLSGVHSYAGVVRDADGRTMIFAVLANTGADAPALATEAALDRVAAALAACHCGVP